MHSVFGMSRSRSLVTDFGNFIFFSYNINNRAKRTVPQLYSLWYFLWVLPVHVFYGISCGLYPYMFSMLSPVGPALICFIWYLLWTLYLHVFYGIFCGPCPYMFSMVSFVGPALIFFLWYLLWALPIHVFNSIFCGLCPYLFLWYLIWPLPLHLFMVYPVGPALTCFFMVSPVGPALTLKSGKLLNIIWWRKILKHCTSCSMFLWYLLWVLPLHVFYGISCRPCPYFTTRFPSLLPR